MRTDNAADIRLNAMLGNCIFYISPMYEFSHSLDPKMGVIGRPACRSLEILGAALQADGGTRSAFAASSIRRRSAAWTILPDKTYQSRRPASALWMRQAG